MQTYSSQGISRPPFNCHLSRNVHKRRSPVKPERALSAYSLFFRIEWAMFLKKSENRRIRCRCKEATTYQSGDFAQQGHAIRQKWEQINGKRRGVYVDLSINERSNRYHRRKGKEPELPSYITIESIDYNTADTNDINHDCNDNINMRSSHEEEGSTSHVTNRYNYFSTQENYDHDISEGKKSITTKRHGDILLHKVDTNSPNSASIDPLYYL